MDTKAASAARELTVLRGAPIRDFEGLGKKGLKKKGASAASRFVIEPAPTLGHLCLRPVRGSADPKHGQPQAAYSQGSEG